MTISIAFLGFGTVARALHDLLARSPIAHTVTGVASRRIGWWANKSGLDPAVPSGTQCLDVHEWLAAAKPDVVFEAIALEPQTGQPALDYLRAVLEHGAHAISANKGPVVHGYRELTALADRMGRRYRFESAVMDGAPLFSLVRECLPLAGLHALSGVFTSTATIVLEAIERGGSLADGIAHAQRLGIAEEDPSYDVDGWDSAVKLCAVANVLLGATLRPSDVVRVGIRDLDENAVRRASAEGTPYRLIGQVGRDEAGVVRASVAPMQCARGSALAVGGTTLVTHLQADVFPGGLTITSHDPDNTTTAYGMFSDFLAIYPPDVGVSY
ncbi:MAG: homoserine dehydrogenase [bacterium]